MPRPNFPTSLPGLKEDYADNTDDCMAADQNDQAKEINAIAGFIGVNGKGLTHDRTATTSMEDTDEVGLWDSLTDTLLKITWANIKATLKTWILGRTYKTVGYDSACDYIVDGTADDVQIQAALTAASAGDTIFLKEGTYYLSAGLTVPAGVHLRGAGIDGCLLIPSASLTSMLSVAGDFSSFRDFSLANASSYATNGITFTGDYNFVKDLYIRGFTNGIYINGSQSINITGGYSFSNTYGIYSADDWRNSTVDGWYSQGEIGIKMTKSAQQPEGVRVVNCKILPNESSATSKKGIIISAGLEIQIEGNVVDQVGDAGILLDGANETAYVKIIGNWIGGNADIADTSGITIAAGASAAPNDITIIGNTFSSCDYYGIRVEYVNSQVITGVYIDGNKFLTNGEGDILINKATGVKIIGNACTHGTYPLREVDSTSVCVVIGNDFAVAPTKSTASYYLLNVGYDAWDSYTPTITASTGTITTKSGTIYYKQIGKTIHFYGNITITTNGTGAGGVIITIPKTAARGGWQGCGRESGLTGHGLSVNGGTTNVTVIKYENSYPGGDGAVLNIAGTYEAA